MTSAKSDLDLDPTHNRHLKALAIGNRID